MSRNTALVFRYRGSGRTATTGKYFWLEQCQEGFLSPSLTAQSQGRSINTLSSCLIQEWARGSWRVTADFTHQRSCICTRYRMLHSALLPGRFTLLGYSANPLRYSLMTSYIYNTNQTTYPIGDISLLLARNGLTHCNPSENNSAIIRTPASLPVLTKLSPLYRACVRKHLFAPPLLYRTPYNGVLASQTRHDYCPQCP